jgi:chaperonin GroES
MKIKPLGDKIVLKQMESEEKTKSGIVLPDTAKEKPQEGKVIAVGTGKIVDGKKVPLEVKAGDKVLYKKYGPDEVKISGEEYLILTEDDILGIIKS